jgi:hypothetical protein
MINSEHSPGLAPSLARFFRYKVQGIASLKVIFNPVISVSCVMGSDCDTVRVPNLYLAASQFTELGHRVVLIVHFNPTDFLRGLNIADRCINVWHRDC